jgi:hypothetical protein
MNRNSLPQRDLTPEEITPITQRLIRNDATSFLKDNYQSICDDWTSLVKKTSLVVSDAQNPMMQLEILGSIITSRDTPALMLRVAYVQLMPVVQTLKDAAAADRLAGRVPRKRGRRDTSVAIDNFLSFKAVRPDAKLFRRHLLRHTNTSRRLSLLTGPSLLLVCAFSDEVDIIVYVLPLLPKISFSSLNVSKRRNSKIKIASLKAIAAQIQQSSPELIRISVDLTQNSGVAMK